MDAAAGDYYLKTWALCAMLASAALGNFAGLAALAARAASRRRVRRRRATQGGVGGRGASSPTPSPSSSSPSSPSSRMYFFLLHLSAADILAAPLNLLPELLMTMAAASSKHGVTFGGEGRAWEDVVCKAEKYIQMLSPYVR